MLPPLPPPGFENFRMPFGFVSLQQVRNLIGVESLYHRLKSMDILCYASDGSSTDGIGPFFWDTAAGRNALEANGLLEVDGKKLLYIVSIPRDLREIIAVRQAGHPAEEGAPGLKEDADLPVDARDTALKSMRAADIDRAIELLREETLTKRLTRPRARDFLRPHFPNRHITERNFGIIFKAVPTKGGRPEKPDKNSDA